MRTQTCTYNLRFAGLFRDNSNNLKESELTKAREANVGLPTSNSLSILKQSSFERVVAALEEIFLPMGFDLLPAIITVTNMKVSMDFCKSNTVVRKQILCSNAILSGLKYRG